MMKVNSKSKILLLLMSIVMILESFLPLSSIAATNTDDVVDVGEVIYYLPEYNEVEITEEESGHQKVYNNSKSKGMWRVIDKKSDGTLVLTSMYPEHVNVTLKGENGYNNGVNVLNKIADGLYSNDSLGVKARSINMEDIDSMLKSDVLNEIQTMMNESDYITYTADGTRYYPSIAAIENGIVIDEAVFTDGLGRSEETDDIISGYEEASTSLSAKIFCGYNNYYLPEVVKNDVFNEVFYQTETYLPYDYDITNIKNYLIATDEACAESFQNMNDEAIIYFLNSLLSNKSFWVASRGVKDESDDLKFGIVKYENEVLAPKTLYKSNDSISSGKYCLSVILEVNPNKVQKVGNTFRIGDSETTIIPVVKIEHPTELLNYRRSTNEEKITYEYFYNRKSRLNEMLPFEDALYFANTYGADAFISNPIKYFNMEDYGYDSLSGSSGADKKVDYKHNYSRNIPYYLNYVDEYSLGVIPDDGVFGLYSDMACTDLVATAVTGTVNGEEFPGFYYFENVPTGVYFIKEITPPTGYKSGYQTMFEKYNLNEKEQIYIQYKQNQLERTAIPGFPVADISDPLMNYGVVKIDRNTMYDFDPVFFYNEKVEMDFYKIESLTGSKLNGAKLAIVDPETNEIVENDLIKFTRSTDPNKPFQSIGLLVDSERSGEFDSDKGADNFVPLGKSFDGIDRHYYDQYPYYIYDIEDGNVNIEADDWNYEDTRYYNYNGHILNEYYLDIMGVDYERVSEQLVWVTGEDNNPNKVSYLKEGKEYILRELEAPEGYAKAQDIRFKVVDGNLVTMTNSLLKMTFSHFVEGENGEYPGAEVRITDANGNVVDTWTTTDTSHEVEGLVDGKAYYYEVTKEDAGIIVPEKVLFVAENNKNVPITAKKLLTTIKVIKLDQKTNEPILNNNFEFGLYKDAACTDLIENAKANQETGEVTFKGVPFGTYYVKETKAPTEYLIKDTVYTVTIDENLPEVGNVYSITATNEKMQMSLADIETKTNNQLIDAEIQVIDKETKEVVDQWVNTKTVHTIKNLEDGKTYIMKQIRVPDGYYLADDIEFVAGDGEEVVMKNDLILTNLVVKLLDEETKEVIKDGDFEFKLYKDEACTEEAGTGTINRETGTATFKNLEFGTYYIDQTKIPMNYSKINTDPVKLVVNNSLPGIGETTNVTVLNRTGKEGPANNNTEPTPQTVTPQSVVPSIVINNNNNNVVTVSGDGATVRTVTTGSNGSTTYTYDNSSMKYDPDELKGSVIYNVPNTESNDHMYYYIAAAILVTLGLGIVIFEKVKNEKTNKK